MDEKEYRAGTVMGGAQAAHFGRDAYNQLQAAGQQASAKLNPAKLSTPLYEAAKLVEADKEHRSLAADQAMMLHMVMPHFRMDIYQLSAGLFKWFQHQGFWPKNWGSEDHDHSNRDMRKAEKLALIHSEVSECLEAVRKGDTQNEAEELADVLVRVLDYAGGFNIDLAGAFHKKMLANYQRPFRHNKGF